VVLDGRALAYEHLGGPHHQARVRPTEGRWIEFWAELDRIGVWDWLPRYEAEDFSTDGYGWQVSISKGGRMVEAGGYNAFPGADKTERGFSTDWSDFQLALRRLLGGLPIA
jgi:hypothetical protein